MFKFQLIGTRLFSTLMYWLWYTLISFFGKITLLHHFFSSSFHFKQRKRKSFEIFHEDIFLLRFSFFKSINFNWTPAVCVKLVISFAEMSLLCLFHFIQGWNQNLLFKSSGNFFIRNFFKSGFNFFVVLFFAHQPTNSTDPMNVSIIKWYAFDIVRKKPKKLF